MAGTAIMLGVGMAASKLLAPKVQTPATPTAPTAPSTTTVPGTNTSVNTAAQAAAQAAGASIQGGMGIGSTILTGPQGAKNSKSNLQGKTILGQ